MIHMRDISNTLDPYIPGDWVMCGIYAGRVTDDCAEVECKNCLRAMDHICDKCKRVFSYSAFHHGATRTVVRTETPFAATQYKTLCGICSNHQPGRPTREKRDGLFA